MEPDVHEMVRELDRILGSSLLAYTTAAEMRHVADWLNGLPVPDGQAERVEVAYRVWRMLRPYDSDATIRAWFMGMKQVLWNLSPSDAIAKKMFDEVLTVAEAEVSDGPKMGASLRSTPRNKR